jgi:phage gp29-like protein
MMILEGVRQRIAHFLVPGHQPPVARTSLFVEQATDDFLKWVTTVAEPDEVLKKAGVTRAALRALTGDDDITAALDTRREALLSTEWRLEEQPDTPEEPMAFIMEQFRPHAERFLRACMEALPYGYSVQEAVFLENEGRICIGEITEKPFEWFVPRLDGTVLWRSREYPQGQPTDPRKYFLTARSQTYRNPYGEAMFSRLYWPWLFRTNGWKFWVKWLERFGNPFVIGMTAGGADVMSKALAAAVNSATIAVGSGDKVDIVAAQGTGEQFERFERLLIARYQRLILGQTLTSDAGGSSGKSGSFALGKIHNEVRLDRRNADCRMCASTGQKLVDVLWALNEFQGSPPRFVIQDETGLEMERAERDAVLVSRAGIKLTPDYFVRMYDYEVGDLDEEAMSAARDMVINGGFMDEDEQVVDQDEGPNDNGAPSQQGRRRVNNAAILFARKFTPNQQAIEDALDAVLPSASSPIADEAIKDAIRSAQSPQDLAQRLATLFAGRSVGEFRDALSGALYVADFMGYAHAAREDS